MITSIFLGTPEASVRALQTTAAMTEVRLVVTRPDKPRGRSKQLVPSPVKEAAISLGLPIAQPVGRRGLLDAVASVGSVDVGVVVAFGMLLRPEVLSLPRKGFVNLHFSLLPRWRGAAPVERAILAGDPITGATLMEINEGLDSGPIISSATTQVDPSENSGELLERLSDIGAKLLGRDLDRFVHGRLLPVGQSGEGVTHASKISTDEARLELTESVTVVARKIRAFNPRPGAFAFLDGRRFKIWSVSRGQGDRLEPGEVRVEPHAVSLGVGDGNLVLETVQAEGGRRMSGPDWARGARVARAVLT
ncbi:MAG: methionyl-tRNA formyltransferase [Acidimicrobiia bacterium]